MPGLQGLKQHYVENVCDLALPHSFWERCHCRKSQVCGSLSDVIVGANYKLITS